MTICWGWVDRFSDGSFKVGEHKVHEERKRSGDEYTGKVVPDNVAEIMALVDLLPDGASLPGGSYKESYDTLEFECTYFITTDDLKPQGEADE